MKLLLASLAAASLAQIDYEYIDYNIIDLLADQPEAVYDYYNDDLGINPRNNQASRKLPPGINLADFRRQDGSFNVQAFRAAVKAAREAQQAAALAAEQAAAEAAAAAAEAAALAEATAQAEAMAQEAAEGLAVELAAELAAEREAAAVADELVDSLNLAGNDGFVASEERYFFTQSATTSTTTTTTTTQPNNGDSCWKCDEMSFTNCATNGVPELCKNGDKDCCFVEVRETKQALQQLCTGCKSKNSCENLRDENFTSLPGARDQCRPNYRYQTFTRNEAFQSVCRQCFNTCSSANPERCFGGSYTTTKSFFKNQLSANQNNYAWGGYYNGPAEIDSIGIPTHAQVDLQLDGTVSGLITTLSASPASESMLNVFFNNAANGKADPSNNDGTRDANEMTFWSVSGASEAWWASDLKTIQDNLRNYGTSARTAASFN